MTYATAAARITFSGILFHILLLVKSENILMRNKDDLDISCFSQVKPFSKKFF